MLEYNVTLDYDDNFNINAHMDVLYMKFTYYRNATYGGRDLSLVMSDGSSEYYVRVRYGVGNGFHINLPFGLTVYTSTDIDYFAGMTWTVELDIDNEKIIIVNPIGGCEVYDLNMDALPEYVIRVSTDDHGKGTVYINDWGSGAVWEQDTSNIGGGDGDGDKESDDISTPDIPLISTLDSSMIKMYNPSTIELSSLASFLWSASFVDNVVKLFQDPMEAIIGLSMVYVTPTTGTSEIMTIGKVSSGVSALPVTDQFVTLDCGTISINEYWGNALDYDPHTKTQIYLPFIGIQTISADDIMGGTLGIKYNIDLLTGACMCFLTTVRGDLDSVLYSFSGNVSAQIPLSGRDLSSVIASIVGIVASAGLTAVTGGASAPLVAGSAMSMLNAKQHIQKSGRLDSAVGVLGIKTPYLIITRPVQSLPQDFNSYRGYPSNITSLLGDLTGYTEVDTVYMKGITATQDEIQMIESSLKGGVIL